MIFEWFSIKICSVGCFLYLFWSKYNRPLCVMPIFTVCHNMYAIYNVLYVEHSIFPSLDCNHVFVWACIGTNWMQTLKSKYFNFHSRIESLELILLSSCYVCFAVDFPVLTIEWVALVGAAVDLPLLKYLLFIFFLFIFLFERIFSNRNKRPTNNNARLCNCFAMRGQA